MSARLPERGESLWWLAASPAVWVAHLAVCYATAAIGCARLGRDAPLGVIRWVVAGATAAALVGIVLVAWRGLRRHRRGSAPVTHSEDTPIDRHRFLALATVLLSGLAAVGVVFVALPAVFFETCR
jgi:hypothetical protein